MTGPRRGISHGPCLKKSMDGTALPPLGGCGFTVVVGEWALIKGWDKTMNSMLNELALMALLLVVVVLSGRI